MTRKKREINTSLLDSVTADMLGGDDVDFLHDDSLRVERILLELVRPDPLQPRRVLPDRVYQAFHDNRLTPTQALRELIQTAQLAARQQGRPFTNVMDLLGNPDDESEQELVPLSPEEQLVYDLVNLAITIRDDGQVNPLTVVDVSEGVSRQFRIETGERRYWATWLLRDFISGYDSDGMIPCIIVLAENSSVFRQAKENTARKGLTAIAMARQAALLLLTVHSYNIPTHAVNNDFYRQALDLDLRGKREHTEAILSAMGGVSKQRFNQYKKLLLLSDEAWQLADRHNLDEGVLRYVVALPPEDHSEMLQQIIQLSLTTRQVKSIIENGDTQGNKGGSISSEIKFARTAIKALDKHKPDDFARAIVKEQGNVHMAFAYLNRLETFIRDAKSSLEGE